MIKGDVHMYKVYNTDCEELNFNIKYLDDETPRLKYINGSNSDWIDCYARTVEVIHLDGMCDFYDKIGDKVEYKQGDMLKVNLGFCLKMMDNNTDKKYCANVFPRSSLFLKTGLFLTTNVSCIDYEYHGDNDWWLSFFMAMRNGSINIGDRLVQFCVREIEPRLSFNEVRTLGKVGDRNGFGSSNR